MSSDKNLKCFTTFLELIQMAGDELTLKALLQAKAGLTENNIISFEDYILIEVCNAFTISKTQIKKGTTGGNRTEALSVYCYFLKLFLKYSYRKIGEIIDKSQATTCRYVGFIENLNDNIPQDRDIKEKINTLYDIIEAYRIENFTNKKN